MADRWCGLQEHPNIIKCYRCWQDMDSHCINLITEYFTSGNLREYRQKHKHLDSKAVRKWARQVRRPMHVYKLHGLIFHYHICNLAGGAPCMLLPRQCRATKSWLDS